MPGCGVQVISQNLGCIQLLACTLVTLWSKSIVKTWLWFIVSYQASFLQPDIWCRLVGLKIDELKSLVILTYSTGASKYMRNFQAYISWKYDVADYMFQASFPVKTRVTDHCFGPQIQTFLIRSPTTLLCLLDTCFRADCIFMKRCCILLKIHMQRIGLTMGLLKWLTEHVAAMCHRAAVGRKS